jgi:hypothetical protein
MREKLSLMVLAVLCGVASARAEAVAAPSKPSGAEAVKVEIGVAPAAVPPGSAAEVTVTLSVNPGFKLNKYPRIKLAVPAVSGLVGGAEMSSGSEAPPPPDKLETNYFKTVDPLKLKLAVDSSASRGRHDVDAKLSYFYCVAASGYCAPAKVVLKIPITVR